MEGEKNESRTSTVSDKGFSEVASDMRQDRNGRQTLLLGAERVCQLGLRNLFFSFSSLSGLPSHPFPQQNQYARDGSMWQKQGCPGSAQAQLSSRHIPGNCTRKSISKRYLRICWEKKKPKTKQILQLFSKWTLEKTLPESPSTKPSPLHIDLSLCS